MTIHNWGIEYCKSYAEQLRDKTCVTRAVHAAECIEYLLSLVQKEWVGLTDAEIEFYTEELGQGELGRGVLRAVVDFLKEKNNG